MSRLVEESDHQIAKDLFAGVTTVKAPVTHDKTTDHDDEDDYDFF
jgi:hypothetical protein